MIADGQEIDCLQLSAFEIDTSIHYRSNWILFFTTYLQVKIWFQNHRYKCKRQAKEKAMAEQNQHNQVRFLKTLQNKRLYNYN
jgi:Homeodomain